MTRCPRTSAPESPRGTVGNPVASIFRTARSCWQSPPITRASYCFGVCADVETVIFDPPSTTWQFVTMTPSCRTMNPVPTPFPCCTLPNGPGWNTSVVTFTTAVIAILTTVPMGSAAPFRDPPLDDRAVELAESPVRSTEQAVATNASATAPTRILRTRNPPMVCGGYVPLYAAPGRAVRWRPGAVGPTRTTSTNRRDAPSAARRTGSPRCSLRG